MKKPKLEYWKYLNDLSFERHGSITLSDARSYASLTCEIDKEGILRLETSSGGGQGDPRIVDQGRKYNEWANLLSEAKKIQDYYFRKK